MDTIISRGPDDTFGAGRGLAARLGRGDVLALEGPLGAGKTRLVQGLAAGLGITGEATSPTFTLIHEYRDGRLPLYHVDLYRMEDAGAAMRLGLEELWDGDGITVIEWAERLGAALPARAWRCRIRITGPDVREITFARPETEPPASGARGAG